MTATLNDVEKKKQAEQSAEEQAAKELDRCAREQGPVPDWSRGAAQAADQVSARDRVERGDDPTPGVMRSMTRPVLGRATSATAVE